MRPTHWRRSTHALMGGAVLVVVAVVVAAAALVAGDPTDAAEIPPVPAAVAELAMTPVDDDAPTPTTAGLTKALTPALSNPDLGILSGRVTDAITGDQLWEQGSTLPMQPASTNKVLTAAAALLTLDRDDRLTTTVVADDRRPGEIVLVGSGDSTLSSAPPNTDPLYRGAARMSDLVDQVKRSGVKVSAVRVDASLYSGPTMAPGWDPADIIGGDIAPMEAVMIDGGRTQPLTVESRRSPTPALDAGRALAAGLGVAPQAVSFLDRPAAGARQIAAVQSAPLMERLRQMMNASDNVMAEAIAREVATEMGRPASFAGGVEAVTNRLGTEGIDLTGAKLADSSGLSVDDRLTAKTLDDVLTKATSGDHPKLRPLLDVLPIAGGSGTLSDRYLDGDDSRSAAGWLRAKTGSLTGTNALAGIVTDASGRVLTFALISNGAPPIGRGRDALDTLAASLRTCGCTA